MGFRRPYLAPKAGKSRWLDWSTRYGISPKKRTMFTWSKHWNRCIGVKTTSETRDPYLLDYRMEFTLIHSELVWSPSSASSHGEINTCDCQSWLKYRILSISYTSFTWLQYGSSKAPSCAPRLASLYGLIKVRNFAQIMDNIHLKKCWNPCTGVKPRWKPEILIY